MVVLPRFLFLFDNIPILLPCLFFAQVGSLLICLPWAGKQPRLGWDILTLPAKWGDLNGPCLETYYRAAQGMLAPRDRGPPAFIHRVRRGISCLIASLNNQQGRATLSELRSAKLLDLLSTEA